MKEMGKRQQASTSGPLAIHADGFRRHLEDLGYAPDSVRWRLRQLATLDRWLSQHHQTASDLDAACVERRVAARRTEHRSTFVVAANFAVPVTYLRQIGAVPPQLPTPSDPTSIVLDQYHNYLATERGLLEGSIKANLRIAESFCRQRALGLDKLTASEVNTYVTALCARSSIGWTKKTVSALASFLRFLHVTGVIAQPLATTLPRISGYRREVACELGEDEFMRMLEGCDRSSDVGLRDRAILTILWRLGLRRGEVARLLIDDIDWRQGVITIRGKGNHHELLPVPIDAGEAIARYLHEGHRRVPPGCRALFVQVRAPEGAMSPDGIGDVVARASARAGLPVRGAHQLRHGTATELLRRGSSWPEIAQVMRHRSMGVTASYATVDPVLTRELARPWPGAR